MLPCNILQFVNDSNLPPLVSLDRFMTVDDPHLTQRKEFVKQDLEELKTAILQKNLSGHRFNLKSLGHDAASELSNPWFAQCSPSSIAVACLEQRVEKQSDMPFANTVNLNNLQDVTETILKINKYLYGPAYQSFLPNEPNIEIKTDSALLLKIYYLIVLNESFFKECMRQYHINNVKVHRKLEFKSRETELASKNFVFILIGVKPNSMQGRI